MFSIYDGYCQENATREQIFDKIVQKTTFFTSDHALFPLKHELKELVSVCSPPAI